MFIKQSHDEVYGCLKGGSGNSGGKRLAISMVEEAWLSKKEEVFTQSHHRLCMWHITQKLPAKVLGDVDVDSDFRKNFHKLIWNVYITPSVFEERWHALIQKYNLSENKWLSDMYEIRDSYGETEIGYRSVRDVEECIIRQRDKRRTTVVEAKVSHNQEDGSFECSCGHYNRHGFLCRHVFCVFGTLGMDTIPENYISRRWRKNPLPDHLRDKRHRNNPKKLKVLLAKVTDMKKELQNDMSSQNEPQNKDGLYEELLGVKAPETVVIMNPNKCGNKGHRRFKSAAEKGKAIKKARMNRKVPFKHRECSKGGQMFHNKRTCDENILLTRSNKHCVEETQNVREVYIKLNLRR
ncbi:FAR1 DNA binding domain-containing protein [Tanacetum coccineum]